MSTVRVSIVAPWPCCFTASLSLLLTDTVVIHNLQVVPEAHRGTRGGPSAPGRCGDADAANAVRAWRYVDLNHVIAAGITTYPGLPGRRSPLT